MSTPRIASSWHVVSLSPDETGRLGRLIGLHAPPGIVIALLGNLGSGKTRLVQGIASGLDVPDLAVNSPTFTLIQEYEGRFPIAHFDTYRLRSPDEFAELGVEEYFSGNWVSLVEWADRVEALLPKDRLTIRLVHLGENERELSLKGSGPRSTKLLETLSAAWPSPSETRVPNE